MNCKDKMNYEQNTKTPASTDPQGRLDALIGLSGGRIVEPADVPPSPKEQASLVAAGALEVLARELDASRQPYGATQVRNMAATAKRWGAA